VSSSLPEDVQERFLRTIPGLERLAIVRPGYAVEYDFLPPTQLFPSLMTKRLAGLFLAGQTNGTSGYEEAAAQGIMAGINAVLRLQGKGPMILTRAEAYIGVLVDDLVTLGTEEPYRLFTSRAEYRLSLRHDTSDIRLVPRGRAVGLQGAEAQERLERKLRSVEEIHELLRHRRVGAADAEALAALESHRGNSFAQALRDPTVTIAALARLDPALASRERVFLDHAETDLKYDGYLSRQEEQVLRYRRMEERPIPTDFDWDHLAGVSSEAREKLKVVRPMSVGQASRIPGVRPPDVALLLVHLDRKAT